MKQPWSISTTIRNPERVRDFLKVLKLMEKTKWTKESQAKFQIILIQNRSYGFGSLQFYSGLPKKDIELIENLKKKITFDKAKDIFEKKNYKDPSMRGRQSFNLLKKIGLVYLDENNKIIISKSGESFLKENYDLTEIFFRSFLKWQLPNKATTGFKDGFNIKPFVGILHLIKKVNLLWSKGENKPVGLHRNEFSIFAHLLINYNDISKTAKTIIEYRIAKSKIRDKKKKKNFYNKYHFQYVKEFLKTDDEQKIKKVMANCIKDYLDNTLRYFRVTGYISLRGGGYYIDLEKSREIEINLLLESDNASIKNFETKSEYDFYLGNMTLPKLPWETKETLHKIANEIINEIKILDAEINLNEFKFEPLEKLSIDGLNQYIENLRKYKSLLFEQKDRTESQGLDKLKEYIKNLNEIYGLPNRPLMLEKYITSGLNALNDALRIKPNYSVGDDNEPKNTAPGGKPDIECFYEKFNSICEVTLMKNRNQWFNEGQPVMRHLRDFEIENNDKPAYCLFIAPEIHRDTINTFWQSIKYEYEGEKQKIVPLTIKQFIRLLEILVKIKENNKKLNHTKLSKLYDNILDVKQVSNSSDWLNIIFEKISAWELEVLI
ncbi:AlwI family type II restriction endonuclease [Candidatus Woesearchaeota archaeon]|jgi:hypothetical protein|nr:AlwI family type II restriction endonuclease [Candidatus Woesearchaeota archaeon]MBT6519114.1 AlwI family type II restriction endonuclease [Candidatus Woesearchaeota archaeon]MBT7366974.1 AlwI family type II restriction endonuclease [Candidatus Woesearchaeota archaeon]